MDPNEAPDSVYAYRWAEWDHDPCHRENAPRSRARVERSGGTSTTTQRRAK